MAICITAVGHPALAEQQTRRDVVGMLNVESSLQINMIQVAPGIKHRNRN